MTAATAAVRDPQPEATQRFKRILLASEGRQISGVKDADNAKALRATLKRDGIYLKDQREGGKRVGGATATQTQTTATELSPTAIWRQWKGWRG